MPIGKTNVKDTKKLTKQFSEMKDIIGLVDRFAAYGISSSRKYKYTKATMKALGKKRQQMIKDLK